ncbi:MAG: septum formation initiator family protein [Nitrospinae bacterium]|nr:septum formation initiator family protein [Nitrospinota bacterium]
MALKVEFDGRAKRLLAFSAVFFVLVTVAAWNKENGFADIQRLSTAINELDTRIADLRLENERHANELRFINTSDIYVEKIARESLGLVKPGEVVYEFVDAASIGGVQDHPSLAQPEKPSAQ